MIEIRQATTSDAALIADISRETFVDTFAEYNSKTDMDLFLDVSFSREQLMNEVGKPGHLFMLATIEREPVGYVFLKQETHPLLSGENAMEIARLYARKHAIGKGAGKKLMQAAIQYAKERDTSSVWLGVWEHNQRAIAFYSSFGFEKFGEHDFLLGNDVQCDWLMRLKINP